MPTGIWPAGEAYFNSPIRDYFPGPTTAGFNPYQTTGFEKSIEAADTLGGYGSDLMKQFMGYMGQGPTMNPYISQVVDEYTKAMNKQFGERMLPSLRGQQIAGGSFGSSGSGIAQAQSAEDLNQTMSGQVANLLAQGFNTTQDRYLNAWNAAPGVFGMGTTALQQPGATRQQVGGLYQDLANRMLQGEMDRWNWYRDAPDRRLQTYGNVLGTGAQGTGNQTVGTTGNYNTIKGIASGLMPALPSIFNALGNSSTPDFNQYQNNPFDWAYGG